ncbi:MAG: DUF4382 domain-containing protein [Chloroflexi bacterium]|nr:DUF4382 domain-containing protein [Chloroflexota bacterium]
MRYSKLLLGLGLGLTLLLAACGAEPTPTSAPTRVVATPTATPAPSPTLRPTTAPATPTATATSAPPVATATRAPAPTATPAPVPGTGTVEVRVTDRPPEGVTKVLVTASKIEAQRSGADGEAGWTTLVESPPVFDLVAVTGLEGVLGSATLPEGSYQQVRLAVTKVVVTEAGQDKEAEVPSDKLQVVGTFQVAAGKTTVLTLDFDADKSVVLAGPRVQFKPVVKLGAAAPAEKAESPRKGTVVLLGELGKSGQTGVAVLKAVGDRTEVTIDIKAGASGVAQPAHIHDKDCTTAGAVKYPLTSVVDGKSTTVVSATLASLQGSQFAVRVHKSAQEAATYVACGEVPQKLTVAIKEVGGSGQSGEAELTSQGDKTEVTVSIKPGAAGVAQPAHIHDKDCTTAGAVKYPLTSVVDGKSRTVVSATLASLQGSQFAIRVHKSAQEVATYVACGEVPLVAAPTPTPTRAPAATATPVVAQVVIRTFSFPDVTIPVGGTVTWVNEHIEHTITSGASGRWDGRGFDSGRFLPGQTFSYIFTTVGTFPYTCKVHTNLTGTVTVTAAGNPSVGAAPSSTPGTGTSSGDYGY